jgi:hypothetical protein
MPRCPKSEPGPYLSRAENRDPRWKSHRTAKAAWRAVWPDRGTAYELTAPGHCRVLDPPARSPLSGGRGSVTPQVRCTLPPKAWRAAQAAAAAAGMTMGVWARHQLIFAVFGEAYRF